jgi:predicted O-methyltransferase YrrM
MPDTLHHVLPEYGKLTGIEIDPQNFTQALKSLAEDGRNNQCRVPGKYPSACPEMTDSGFCAVTPDWRGPFGWFR